MTAILKKTLFSTRLTAVLFIVFATAMGLGTFIESWYSTETAWIWIYNTHWFEAIMAFFMINFAGNIFRYRLLRKEKWAVLLLHLAFIIILAGAFVTRYISYEGIMPIREGETADFFLSEKTYLNVFVDGDLNGELRRKTLSDPMIITPEARSTSLPWRSDFNGKPFTIAYAGFIKGAEETLVPDGNGATYLKIVEAGGGNRHDHYIKDGEVASIHNILFALNNPTPGAVNIAIKDSVYTILSPFEGTFMRMADQLSGTLIKDSVQPLMLRSLYNAAGMQFVFPEPPLKGRFYVTKAATPENAPQNALFLDVSIGSETRRVSLLGGKGFSNDPEKITLDGLDFYLSYGSVRRQLPFSITLYDFIAEKYPGTERSYAAFRSKIRVNDDTEDFDYDIYMNHVLDHRGYRFFQASFDPDERGTILSVNHDLWGTRITYTGYFLLYLGLMGIMFYGKTR
ncbi:MAG: cytochrome c biogenesis protein ResB, partial [Sinomicrobium sp.]|nr:cytochrome c biogenesis protein ResB [Sinomicrobium sp.]